MKILLLNPPYRLSAASPYSKTGAILPPLGLLSIASYLRDRVPGVDITVSDAPAEDISVPQLATCYGTNKFDLIGISVYSATFVSVVESVKVLKKSFPEALLVAGGPHSSINPEECIELAGFHVSVMGEGEETLSLLVSRMMKGLDYADINGLVLKKNDARIHRNVRAKEIAFEACSFPARDLLEMSKYRPALGTYKRLPALSMITSRGCPYHCSFCSRSIFGTQYRALSPARVVDEIEHLISKYGAKEILFNDDTLTFDNKRVFEICRLIIDKKLDITWACNSRVNLVSKDLLATMKKAGCFSIGYGVESGDPEVLAGVCKGISLESVKEAFQLTKKAGIESRASFILGFPGETLKTIKNTVNFAIKLDADYVIFNIAIPLPGTELYEAARKNNLLLYDGVDLYSRTDGAHVLLKNPLITTEELKKAYKNAYRRYYIRPWYFIKQVTKIRSLDEIKRFGQGLNSFSKWVFSRAH